MNSKISVSLFTPFHPDTGGGAACLRSAIEQFERVDLTWYYLGNRQSFFPGTVRIGSSLMGGAIYRDLLMTPLLWAGWRSPEVRRIARAIADAKPDVCWTVAMNEGVAVGLELLRVARKPLHVSVHDDQADAICPRSRRYGWMRPLVARSWKRLMHAVADSDVISEGMQRYYRKKHGLDSWVFHPCVKAMPALPPYVADESTWVVGHIGAIYSAPEFLAFVRGLCEAAQSARKGLKLVMIGEKTIADETICSLMPAGAVLERSDAMPEAEAIPMLAKCDFVYAMYPFDRRNGVFRSTSFPTKLSTYVQARRPIFAHTPADSTLEKFVLGRALGINCTSLRADEISQDVARLMSMTVPEALFESAREREYGLHNARKLEECLTNLAEPAR